MNWTCARSTKYSDGQQESAMAVPHVNVCAEYQASIPFDKIDWAPINADMKDFQ